MKKILFILSVLISCNTLFAQEEGKNQENNSSLTTKESSKEKIQPSPEMAKIQLATQLAKYGYENASVLSLIQAANMFSTIGEKELEAEEIELEEAQDDKERKISFKVEDLLKEAKDLAGKDATYLALIDKVEKGMTRSVVGGTRSGIHKVPAHSTHTFRYKFYAKQRATVVVSGDGDTDLDLYIYDSNGNLITSDTDYSDDCVCAWIPYWTTTFTIKVVNRGNVYNKYYISIE